MVWRSKTFSIWSGLYGGLGWFGRSPSPVKSKGFCSPGVILFAASNCRSQALAVPTLSTLSIFLVGWFEDRCTFSQSLLSSGHMLDFLDKIRGSSFSFPSFHFVHYLVVSFGSEGTVIFVGSWL
ncbi:hypothetical protein F2Q70_00023048 [Brassica cretica]|uniref:Uncharacterized protein n=1 Tax=Brassica cretica TaxID=69181 RepID=A0A8S9GQB4_BRACR|nr:hypothetical protein F2Q70_00023048 [Brassica cretica]KAF2559096.1 hypothetical protein F2Q68_00017336 [Brassica cretica]